MGSERSHTSVGGGGFKGAKQHRRREFASVIGETDRGSALPCDNFLKRSELGGRGPKVAKRRWWIWLVGLAALVVAAAAAVAQHEHPTGAAHWYDYDCCGLKDCEPISAGLVSVTDGKTYYTTSFGTYAVQPKTVVGDGPTVYETKIRPSKDGQTHACIYNGQLWCLYLPGGT